MNRRGFLAVATGAVTGAALAACARKAPMDVSGDSAVTDAPATPTASRMQSPRPSSTPSLVAPTAPPPPLPTTKGAIPVGTAITEIPVPGPYMAWTIDDGTDPDVVVAYARLAEETGNRLTFFLNGNQPSWTDHAHRLRPLVESGQIQLGNHTWSHPDLRALSTAGIQDQLQRNENFIQSTYGVSAKPFYRPPFGYVNAHGVPRRRSGTRRRPCGTGRCPTRACSPATRSQASATSGSTPAGSSSPMRTTLA